MSDYATKEQDTPHEGKVPVVEMLCSVLQAPTVFTLSEDLASKKLRSDLLARQELGRARYGTVLKTHNGRDAVIDAYQEALDLSQYLAQAVMEGAPLINQLAKSIELSVELRAHLDKEANNAD